MTTRMSKRPTRMSGRGRVANTEVQKAHPVVC